MARHRTELFEHHVSHPGGVEDLRHFVISSMKVSLRFRDRLELAKAQAFLVKGLVSHTWTKEQKRKVTIFNYVAVGR